MEFLSYLISGISLGSIYAIIALGYTMVYGIAKMLNFAHGDIIMIGGYVSFCAMFYLGLPNIVAVLLAVIVCTILGIVIERLAYKPLRSAPSLAVLITAIGVSYFLQNSALLIWKAAARVYPPVVEDSAQLFGGRLLSLGQSLNKAAKLQSVHHGYGSGHFVRIKSAIFKADGYRRLGIDYAQPVAHSGGVGIVQKLLAQRALFLFSALQRIFQRAILLQKLHRRLFSNPGYSGQVVGIITHETL